ncbi:MAG: YggS family pyridoxal phosphate-dependent enzyme [Planctomycetota bacterium]|nr:YggS family pyridoxal phosphate-dependent enzyme [Planctomycetota bacterium]
MPITAQGRETLPTGDSLRRRYESVRARIEAATERRGRRGRQVILVAVTSGASIDQIRQLLALGQVDLAETHASTLAQHAAQVEEFLQRHRELPSARRENLPGTVRWHMIGPLPRNRVRKILEMTRLIHSVDSLRLAEELQTAAAARLPEPLEVLIQVNAAGDRRGPGVAPPATRHLVEQIETMFNLRIRGLMCSAPPGGDPEAAREVFQRCHELFLDTRRSGLCSDRFDILSMGCSEDFEVAIECGANIVRVGRAIFGGEGAADRGR